MVPLRLRLRVSMLPANVPEPLIVVPPPRVWVAIFTLDPLTVPIQVSTPSLKTTLVELDALLVIVIFMVEFDPGHAKLPL